MVEQPLTIYETVQRSTPQTTITDVLLGAVWVVIGLAMVAVALGLIYAGVLIGIRRISGSRSVADASVLTRLGLNSSSIFPGS